MSEDENNRRDEEARDYCVNDSWARPDESGYDRDRRHFCAGWDARNEEVSHLRATMAVTVQTLKVMLKRGSFSVYGESMAESEIEHIERALAQGDK